MLLLPLSETLTVPTETSELNRPDSSINIGRSSAEREVDAHKVDAG